MKGKICDWKDDRGFGFIISEDRSDRIFVHISDIKTKERRPKVNDLVNFDITKDAKKKPKAKNVVIEGLSPVNDSLKYPSHVKPVKKTAIDYFAITVLLLSISAGAFHFYQNKDINKLAPFGAIVVVMIIVLSRQKKPKEKHFTCARCKTVTEFNKRTIQAWNKGMVKLYCAACHQQWLSTQPEPEQSFQNRGVRNGGCLGVFVTLVLIPILTFISIYSWLS